MAAYPFRKIEKKWQEYWKEHPELYSAKEKNGEKAYILDMFPYPSADGLHTGHIEGYTATDIISRYLILQGKNVLHPQGWDAFGLPAENFAIKTKTHPSITTQHAIANFKRQMDILGFSYDWSREIDSSNPNYYKWTQWFFLLLYKNGLAYKSKAKVNWCPKCQTVLANEQAEGGVCERCGTQVVQKDLEQWFFRITDFIEDKGKTSGLISGLDKIDWPEHTKIAQKNWIGKSEGAQFEIKFKNSDLKIEVFTTRLDTVFGMTFALIAPEHPIIGKLSGQISNIKEVEKYIKEAKKKSELQRMTEEKEKTGIELKGVKVINPFTKQDIPLFVSDFVLAHYGTGAVMAVPAHDHRDFDFAKKFNLDIKAVIMPEDQEIFRVRQRSNIVPEKVPNKKDPKYNFIIHTISEILIDFPTEQDGVLINSGDYDGLTSEEARKKLTAWLEKNKIGKKTINYKLRDWLVSRQRYWGAPIPIIYCDKCGTMPVPEKDLPVLLPDDVDFMPTGESPLARSKKFHDVKCPKCGKGARRESDTMDTFVCSSWYYFRYSDPRNEKEFASKKQIKKWLPVDLYVGGAEHTVLHLLYSRFFTKVLHNLGFIDFDEPFLKLRHQGIIIGEGGRRMSKSLGNVVNPDDVVAKFGADALRLFEMFMGPLEDAKKWDTKGITGVYRFLNRIWKLAEKVDDVPQKREWLMNKTILEVSARIERLSMNTAISALMIFFNSMENSDEPVTLLAYGTFLKLLTPFAPHITNELAEKLKIDINEWPKYDPKKLERSTFELVIQINGKVRAIVSTPADITGEQAKELALSQERVKAFLAGKKPSKIIYVPGKLINIVLDK